MKSGAFEQVFTTRTRNPGRPTVSKIINRIFHDFRSLTPGTSSLISGQASFYKKKLYIIGQEKKNTASDNNKNTWEKGMLSADDHSCILEILNQAKASDPDRTFIFTLIDTYGADISIDSARKLQLFFLSTLIEEFLSIPVRTISLIVGEGTSSGALAIQVADVRGIMEDGFYVPISPEDMAIMAFKDPSRIDDALRIMHSHPKELKRLGIVDRVVQAPDDIADISGMAENIKQFLIKAIRDLSRSRIKKLIKNREKRVKRYGIMKGSGRFYELSMYIKRPFKRAFLRPPPDIRIIDQSGLTEVSGHYENNMRSDKESGQYIECGRTADMGMLNPDGCGAVIGVEEFMKNYNTCPRCGRSHIMGASGWIDCLTDKDSFHELYPEITVDQLLDEDRISPYYRDYLKKQQGRSPFSESLVVGVGRVNNHQVVMCISEFYFCSGSMGVVFGEKFRRAVDWAIQENLPLISVCCSGGLRLYEGILSLMQMAKTVESVLRLKRHGLFYISILANPSTGGTIASFASLGDVVIAEPDALVTIAGPRIMKLKGFEVKPEYLRADYIYSNREKIYENMDYFHKIRGIQEICHRKDMKSSITKYLELYEVIRSRRRSIKRR